jgi:hypothetical protein
MAHVIAPQSAISTVGNRADMPRIGRAHGSLNTRVIRVPLVILSFAPQQMGRVPFEDLPDHRGAPLVAAFNCASSMP